LRFALEDAARTARDYVRARLRDRARDGAAPTSPAEEAAE
jgi:hypothetical protein